MGCLLCVHAFPPCLHMLPSSVCACCARRHVIKAGMHAACMAILPVCATAGHAHPTVKDADHSASSPPPPSPPLPPACISAALRFSPPAAAIAYLNFKQVGCQTLLCDHDHRAIVDAVLQKGLILFGLHTFRVDLVSVRKTRSPARVVA
jgi:hypothetical protein